MLKDRIITNLKREIKSVADYIEVINQIVQEKTTESRIIVFRGETKKRESCCTPNIFRQDVLSSNSLYEISLFNAMRQNKLSNNMSYLENAIDAQHGEFPSRLLDVSYNCLNALYFAVTPYYRNSIKSSDSEDGMVYIFYIDEIFSPSAKNINDNYNAIIKKDKIWFNDQPIFKKNYKFIDHTRLNNRIIAQQGAFILFQGDTFAQLPEYMFNGIEIPHQYKAKIRKELSQLFGINTGTIYPEIVNLAKDLSQKSKMIVTEPFSWESELKYALITLEKELIYYGDYLYLHDIEHNNNEFYALLQSIKLMINNYRLGLIKFCNDYHTKKIIIEGCNTEENLNDLIDRYNSIISDFEIFVQELCGSFAINELLIKNRED